MEDNSYRQMNCAALIQFTADLQKYALGDQTIADKYDRMNVRRLFHDNPSFRTYACLVAALKESGHRMTNSIYLPTSLPELIEADIRIYDSVGNTLFVLLVECDCDRNISIIDSRY